MILNDSKVARAAAALVCLLLVACGGGASGGNGTPTPDPNPPPAPALTLSTATLTFSTNQPTVTPASQPVTATVTGVPAGSNLYLRIDVAGNAVATVNNIQVTGATTGSAVVVPQNAGSLGLGTHTATITVTACTTSTSCTSGIIGQPRTISVTYTIAGITSAPSSAQITITDQSQPADYATTVALQSSASWTATSSNPALAVSPASGNGASTQVTLTLSAAAVQQMQIPSGVTPLNVTFSNGTTQLVLPVTINVIKPQIVLAMPRVEPAGQAGQIYLRGEHLNLASIGQIRFGATAATGFTVDGPQVIRASHPALPAGTYPVTFTDASNNVIPRSSASMVVVDPLDVAASTLEYAADGRVRHVTDLHFDAERRALVLVVQYPAITTPVPEFATQVLRFQYFGGGAWSPPSVLGMAVLSSLALRSDGAGWMATVLRSQVAGAMTNDIVMCTPTLVGVGGCTTELRGSPGNARWTQIGMTNDNQPLVVAAGELLRYSIANRTMSSVATGVAVDGQMAVSRDGQVVVLGSGAAVQPLKVTTAGSTVMTPMPTVTAAVTRLSMARGPGRALVNGRRVIDPLVFTELASLPATTLGGVLNDAGTRAYTFDANGTIRTFDVSAAQFSGVFPEIGAGIVPAGDPGAAIDGSELRMTISPDGRTLFLAGSARIVVQPLP